MIATEDWERILAQCEPFELPIYEAVRRRPLDALDRFSKSGWQWARLPDSRDWEAVDWIERVALRTIVFHDPEVRRAAYGTQWLQHLVLAVVQAPDQLGQLVEAKNRADGRPRLPLWLDPLVGVMDAMCNLVTDAPSIERRDRERATRLLLSQDGLAAVVDRLYDDAVLIAINSVSTVPAAKTWGWAIANFLEQAAQFWPGCVADRSESKLTMQSDRLSAPGPPSSGGSRR